jgi:hypothetical protein
MDGAITNSVGTGSEVALPPAHEPPGKLASQKKKKRKFKSSTSESIQESVGYFPFKIEIDFSEFILYGKSVSEIKLVLRKIYRPEAITVAKITRLQPNEVIKYFYDKRMAALHHIANPKAE